MAAAAALLVSPIFMAIFTPLALGYSVLRKIASKVVAVAPPMIHGACDGVGSKVTLASPPERVYGLVVYGATGFTGRLCVEYLAKQYGVAGQVRWAIAGRSEAKLRSLLEDVAERVGDREVLKVPTVMANSENPESIAAMCASTKAGAPVPPARLEGAASPSGQVLITTAGPFALHGTIVVEQCAYWGTSYCAAAAAARPSRRAI